MKIVLAVILTAIIVAGGIFVVDKIVDEKNNPETEVTTSAEQIDLTLSDQSVKLPEITKEAVTENSVKQDHVPEVPDDVTHVTNNSIVTAPNIITPTENSGKSENVVNKEPHKVETNTESSEKITSQEALNIALNHAGFSASEVRKPEVEFDFENGVYEYEVTFENGKYDYEYDIDAFTGKIKSHQKEIDD